MKRGGGSGRGDGAPGDWTWQQEGLTYTGEGKSSEDINRRRQQNRSPAQAAADVQSLLMDPIIAAETAKALAAKAAALTAAQRAEEEKEVTQPPSRRTTAAQAKLESLFAMKDSLRRSAFDEHWQGPGALPEYMENPNLEGAQ